MNSGYYLFSIFISFFFFLILSPIAVVDVFSVSVVECKQTHRTKREKEKKNVQNKYRLYLIYLEFRPIQMFVIVARSKKLFVKRQEKKKNVTFKRIIILIKSKLIFSFGRRDFTRRFTDSESETRKMLVCSAPKLYILIQSKPNNRISTIVPRMMRRLSNICQAFMIMNKMKTIKRKKMRKKNTSNEQSK